MSSGVLRSVFTTQELGSLADVMVERRPRLRQGLDEALESWDVIDFCELFLYFILSFFVKCSSPAVQFATFSILPQALYCTSQDIIVLSHEPDADFDGASITTPSNKDDEIEDVDIQTDLCPIARGQNGRLWNGDPEPVVQQRY